MKRVIFLLSMLLLFILPQNSKSQGLLICNRFDSTSFYISIDSGSVWEIGTPNKGSFDSSFSPPNSIVTDLMNPYRNNDTSAFIITFKDTALDRLPNYLGLFPNLEMEFNHRFEIDSGRDFGRIELSFDNKIWYDMLSTDNGLSNSFHYNLASGDTAFDSIAITGVSNGWIRSKINKDIDHIIISTPIFPDSLLIRVSLVTDSATVLNGWQIDDICLKMDLSSGINDEIHKNIFSIYPNPVNDILKIENSQFTIGEQLMIRTVDVNGAIVLAQKITWKDAFSLNVSSLTKGLYILDIHSEKDKSHFQGKFLKE